MPSQAMKWGLHSGACKTLAVLHLPVYATLGDPSSTNGPASSVTQLPSCTHRLVKDIWREHQVDHYSAVLCLPTRNPPLHPPIPTLLTG